MGLNTVGPMVMESGKVLKRTCSRADRKRVKEMAQLRGSFTSMRTSGFSLNTAHNDCILIDI